MADKKKHVSGCGWNGMALGGFIYKEDDRFKTVVFVADDEVRHGNGIARLRWFFFSVAIFS